MAFSKKGLLGIFSGQVSNLVIYERGGTTVVRSKTAHPPPKATGIKKQAQQRFARVIKLICAIKKFIDTGFYDVSGEGTPYNAAISENLGRLKQVGDPEDIHWLMPAMGTRAGALDPTIEINQGQALIRWGEPMPAMAYKSDDRVLLLAINTTTLNTTVNLNAAKRSQQQATLGLPPAEEGQHTEVFLAFTTRLRYSDKKNPEMMSMGQRVEG